MYQPQPSDTRTIILTDLIGNEIKLLLWGARAREVDVEDVRAASTESAVIAIFVGTLPKMSQGDKSLTGTSACCWYINEDLPEINAFHASLGKEVAPDALIDQGVGISIREPPVEMTVKQLLALDPFNNLHRPFICKVTITRLGSDAHWWFLSRGASAIRLPMLMGLGSDAQTMDALPLRPSQNILSMNTPISMMKGKGQSLHTSITGHPVLRMHVVSSYSHPIKAQRLIHRLKFCQSFLSKAGENASTGDSAGSASKATGDEPALGTAEADVSASGNGKVVQSDQSKTKRSNAGVKNAVNAKKTRQ